MIEIAVRGEPRPQGSHRAFMVGGKPRITDSNRRLAQWRDLVALAAQGVAPPELIEAPVRVEIEFSLKRPKSLPKRVPDSCHVKKPDLDKLTRAILDAITGVVVRDDSQVVEIAASKRYGVPGAIIRVVPLEGH